MKRTGFVALLGGALACALNLLPACGGSSYRWKSAQSERPMRAARPSKSLSPRWVRLPSKERGFVHDIVAGGGILLIADGLRIVQWPDRSLATAQEVLPGGDVRSVKLPARLGGGYLFYSPTSNQTPIWRAKDWTGPLQPVATLSERLEDIQPGFDRLYCKVAHTQQMVALDLESGKVTDLGPLPPSPGYQSVAFVDEWFGAVSGDMRGVLATFDAGASWHPTGIGNSSATLQVDGSAVIVSSSSSSVRITADGRFEQQQSANADNQFSQFTRSELGKLPDDSSPKLRIPRPLGEAPLRDAVLYGWPLGDDTAVVATQGSVGTVRLSDGATLQTKQNAYPGIEPCVAMRFGQEVGFVCSEKARGTQIYRLTSPLGLERVMSFSSPRFVSSSGNGWLVVRGECGSPEASETTDAGKTQPYCIITQQSADQPASAALPAQPPSAKPGTGKKTSDGRLGVLESRKPRLVSREVRVRGDIGTERLVALSDGRIAVLIPPRLGTEGVLNIIDENATSQVKLQLDTDDDGRQLLGAALWLDGLRQLDAETIATWVVTADSYNGVTISLNGKVKLAPNEVGNLASTILSGPYAMDIVQAKESTDYGFNWRRFELPPGLSSLTPKSNRSGRVLRPRVGCSEVGCGYDEWLRIGRLPPLPDDADNESASSPEPAGLAEAELPPRVSALGSSYSNWNMECYPTGQTSASAGSLSATLNREAAGRPRRGLAVGFVPSGLGFSGVGSDIDSTAYRPFLGVAGPRPPAEGLAFDVGQDSDNQFRAYAWGRGGTAWPKTSSWVVRVADRYDLDSVWSTAPTQTPWTDLNDAAQTFGADRANRYGTSWNADLEPDEQAGVLRVNARGSSELHFIEKDKAIVSIAGSKVTRIAGVVKARGRFFVGEQEGNRFRIHELQGGKLERIANFPLWSMFKAQLVRSTDGDQLGVLVNSRYGSWYIYALGDDRQLEAPLVYDREELNQQAPACHEGAQGWLVNHWLPLTRSSPSTSSGILDLQGSAQQLRATNATAKLILSEDSICLSSLAAQTHQSGGDRLHSLRRETPAKDQSVPLVVSDRQKNVRASFRCVPE